MIADSLPQVSLGTAALIIFAVCVGFVFLRGVTRMLLGAVVFCASAWVGFLVWQTAPTLAMGWTGKPEAWLSTGLPILAFLATFFLLRAGIGFFLRPFKPSGEGGNARSAGGILLRLALAVIPAGFLWLTGATMLHHFGSIAEIQASALAPSQDQQTPMFSKALEYKNAIVSILPAEWLKRLDPLTDPDHLSLAKIITAQLHPPSKPVIDPETGKPYPRAIVVDDPELQELASEGHFSTLLRHPMFQKALEDPKVQKAIREMQR